MDRSSTSSVALDAQGVREWWLRTVLVLQAPRAVFAALREDDRDSAANRSEPVLLIILLAGMALALASTASRGYDGLDLAVWLFLGGAMTGIAAYWAFGALLYGAARALGSQGRTAARATCSRLRPSRSRSRSRSARPAGTSIRRCGSSSSPGRRCCS